MNLNKEVLQTLEMHTLGQTSSMCLKLREKVRRIEVIVHPWWVGRIDKKTWAKREIYSRRIDYIRWMSQSVRNETVFILILWWVAAWDRRRKLHEIYWALCKNDLDAPEYSLMSSDSRHRRLNQLKELQGMWHSFQEFMYYALLWDNPIQWDVRDVVSEGMIRWLLHQTRSNFFELPVIFPCQKFDGMWRAIPQELKEKNGNPEWIGQKFLEGLNHEGSLWKISDYAELNYWWEVKEECVMGMKSWLDAYFSKLSWDRIGESRIMDELCVFRKDH